LQFITLLSTTMHLLVSVMLYWTFFCFSTC
jgi:hypothetical protein